MNEDAEGVNDGDAAGVKYPKVDFIRRDKKIIDQNRADADRDERLAPKMIPGVNGLDERRDPAALGVKFSPLIKCFLPENRRQMHLFLLLSLLSLLLVVSL